MTDRQYCDFRKIDRFFFKKMQRRGDCVFVFKEVLFNCVTQDEPQAICVCMEQTPACGSDNKTYTTPCALHEEAMRRKSSSFLTLQHLGPCQSRPWILSPLEDVLSVFGQRLALNCEAKGFPVPEIFWEFHAADGRTVLKLPGTLPYR